MAQPVFDEGPLEQYLKQTGEGVELMPGTMSDLPFPQSEDGEEEDESGVEVKGEGVECDDRFFGLLHLLPPGMIQFVETLLSASKHALPNREFAERFKYVVISSSLLSPSLSTPATASRRSWPPSQTPPALHLAGPSYPSTLSRRAQAQAHSRSASDSSYSHIPGGAGFGGGSSLPITNWSVVLAAVAVMALLCGSLLFVVLFGTAAYVMRGQTVQGHGVGTLTSKPDVVEPTFTALNELINASDLWDSAVQEAITILEKDERGPSSPSTSTSLRVALHTTLHTTESQSENVRQLLSALASHTELAQLSEMYAPPSPVRASFNTLDSLSPSGPSFDSASDNEKKRRSWRGGETGQIAGNGWVTTTRPMTLPMTRKRTRTLSAPEGSNLATKANRASWAAGSSSYTALAEAGSPSKQVLKRREKRRSDLSALLDSSSFAASSSSLAVGAGLGLGLGSTSAPASPLPDVEELEEGNETSSSSASEKAPPSGSGSTLGPPRLTPIMGGGKSLPVTPDEKDGDVVVGAFGAAALEMKRNRRSGGLDMVKRARDSGSSQGSVSGSGTFPFGSPTSSQESPVHKRHSKAFYGPQSSPRASDKRLSTLSFPTGRASGQSHTSSMTSSSRFTSLHPANSSRNSVLSPSSTHSTTVHQAQPRHPLSLSTLHNALQSALSSKRYAASHLLALRFVEEDDYEDVYWEDVRSVIGLLTSALAGAVVGLCQVLDEVEGQRLRDQTPSPALDGPIQPFRHSRSHLASYFNGEDADDSDNEAQLANGNGSSFQGGLAASAAAKFAPTASSLSSINRVISRKRTMEEMRDFAPVPSHLARFAEHVDAISGALHDAHMQLELCVGALSDGEGDGEAEGVSPTEGADAQGHGGEQQHQQQHEALEAYERLRRELGLALRECERGRERLLEIVLPRHPHLGSHSKSSSTSEDEVPALGPDAGSEDLDSDRPHSIGFPKMPANGDGDAVLVEGHQPELDHGLGLKLGGEDEDGVGELSIPMPIDQVFEAESSVGQFTRERSKLSREERIKLAKARRESGGSATGIMGSLDSNDASLDGEGEGSGRRERWGPGGEVVQELKDVIWKVGEKRRKMAEASNGTTHTREERRERGASMDAAKLFRSAAPGVGSSSPVPSRPVSETFAGSPGQGLGLGFFKSATAAESDPGLQSELTLRLNGLSLEPDVLEADEDDETTSTSSITINGHGGPSSISIPILEQDEGADEGVTIVVVDDAS